MWLGSRGRSGQIMVMRRIRYIRELQNIFIKVMMDLNNSIIRYGLKGRERIGRSLVGLYCKLHVVLYLTKCRHIDSRVEVS